MKPLIVALDLPTAEAALALSGRLDPARCRLKVGKELFTRAGPGLLETLQHRGFELFLDLKYHDIPNTVAAACRVAADLGVWMVDVHALGGQRMLEAARAALDSAARPPLLVAVTVLTSHDDAELQTLGFADDAQSLTLRLARLAWTSGVDGFVCSAREAPLLRNALGDRPCLVTPGIRPATAAADDQRRTLTPAAARRAGADYLVVGRPVTRAADPAAAVETLLAELDTVR